MGEGGGMANGAGREDRWTEDKGYAAKMNVCCCNGKFLLIAVLYTIPYYGHCCAIIDV